MTVLSVDAVIEGPPGESACGVAIQANFKAMIVPPPTPSPDRTTDIASSLVCLVMRAVDDCREIHSILAVYTVLARVAHAVTCVTAVAIHVDLVPARLAVEQEGVVLSGHPPHDGREHLKAQLVLAG